MQKVQHLYTFEDTAPQFEANAIVYITDNEGNKYNFEAVDNKYLSTIEFKAVANRKYQLHITTKNGKSYSSTSETLTTVNEMQSIVPTVTTNEGVLGVEIIVNSFDPTNTSKYYRYEYEETYKIIAPKWVNTVAVAKYLPAGSSATGEIKLQPRTTEARTCFTTKNSDYIILTKTNNLSEDRVHFPVRFISSVDHILRERYSILVKQYVQSLASQTFYQTLKNSSLSESILSQNQPGYFSGNIKSDDNTNEKVIGFFDVCSYSEKRLFFNFNDVFPNKKIPNYPYYCPLELKDTEKVEHFFLYCFATPGPCRGATVFNGILTGRDVWYDGYNQFGVIPSDGTVTLETYPIQCGDCTSFSKNIKPSFWID